VSIAGFSGARVSLRAFVGAAALLLAVTLVAPLWSTAMEAPQYHDEETLVVTVYAGRVAGDIQEINTLNQYVGVHLPLDTPELHATPWVLGALVALAILVFFLPQQLRRAAAGMLLVLMLATAVGGAVVLRQRLYEMGHERDTPIFEGVPDFTPPILGSAKIANFTVSTRLGVGAWSFIVAGGALGWGLLADRRRAAAAVESPSAREEVRP